MSEGSTNGRPAVALVLPGGGARGAYEAGALSVLLPALAQRGERPMILCGTSVGAINAATLASLAHLSLEEQAEALVGLWLDLRKRDVVAPLVGLGLPLTVLQLLGDILDVPGVRLASVLDPRPMRKSLDRWVDWDALQRNVRDGQISAVCVVATALSRGAPVAFVEARRSVEAMRSGDEIHYVRVPLEGDHVRASAAIPFVFPPVEILSPRSARDHYVDGSTRLNTPLKPALALGADRVIVIGFEPFAGRPRPTGKAPPPCFADVAANVIDGLMLDPVSADVQRVAAVNDFLVAGASAGPALSARAYRSARGRQPYRKIGYALVAPPRRGEIGALAEDVFTRRYAGVRGLLRPDYTLISRLLGGKSRSRGELLSFLLFDETFMARLIEVGARDARAWLARHPGFWCSDRAHDFDVDHQRVHSVRQHEALLEWRELRRRT